MPAQRVRIRFRKAERVRYISHLDVLRYWERVFRRAALPLSYSQGFTPHPKLAFAAPLPLGFAAEAEILDATLDAPVPENDLRGAIGAQTSSDLAMVDLEEVPLTTPPPQAMLTWADYRFDVTGVPAAEFMHGVERFLSLETFEWVDERREKPRTYDMRAGVASLDAQSGEGVVTVRARLSASQDFTVRPEELLKALAPGATAPLYVRTMLYLDGEPAPSALAAADTQ